ncbi:MAG: asparaginase, partial [Pseudomonas stutzeri]|nr:asparaginase [Stutzerimonas stutzeri]
MAVSNPVLANVWRGNAIESRHRGAVVAVNITGKRMLALGDVDAPVFPRSAIKPLQAVPLVESGAAERYGLGDAEIALACASHNGEPIHVEAVGRWLVRIGLSPNDLECGPQRPLHEASADALIQAGQKPAPIHHNCSGKHAGMLTTCRFFDEDTCGYTAYGHPTQQRWFDVLGDLTGLDPLVRPHGIDGCGVPVLAWPLERLAYAFARFADPAGLSEARRNALGRIRGAIAARPEMIAGTGRLCSRLAQVTGGELIGKVGGEGVYGVAVPARGLGLMLKIDDGAKRAAEVAVGASLEKLGLLKSEWRDALAEYFRPAVRNQAGT